MERRRFFGFAAGGAVAMALKGGGNQLSQFMRLAFLRSPNFVAGSAGWTINQDGSAEFNNVTIRGGLVVDGTGLYYSPTPAFGNLTTSIADASGTDAFGNAYVFGVAEYSFPAGGNNPGTAVSYTHAGPEFFTAPNAGGPWTDTGKGSLFDSSGNLNITAPTVTIFAATQTDISSGPVRMIGGTAASPTLITTDSWHSLGALGAGGHYTVTLGRYRLTTDNEVELDILVSGDGAQATSSNFANTLPAAYRPATSHNNLPMGTNRAITAGDIFPRLSVTSAGVVTVTNQGTANAFAATVRVPLD